MTCYDFFDPLHRALENISTFFSGVATHTLHIQKKQIAILLNQTSKYLKRLKWVYKKITPWLFCKKKKRKKKHCLLFKVSLLSLF